MAKVLVESLTKRFGSTVAVDNLTLQIEDGEFVCLLGPSGCGKTTTLRCIAGLETQDSGNIYVGDTLVNGLSPSERDIAMVFQFPVLYPAMNVKDNLSFPLKQRRQTKEEINQRVLEVARILGLEHILKAEVSALNVGERQRVAIGRALVRRPKALLLDEALTNLDTQLKVSLIGELRKLHEKLKLTVVYVTHDQSEAMMMADRIAVMSMGKLQQYDTPERLYDEPANLFVAGFIGIPPINLFEATLRNGEMVLQGGTTLKPSGFAAEELPDGREYVVGFRPDDVEILPLCSDPSHLKGIVGMSEFSEDRWIVNIQLGTSIVKVITRKRLSVPEGEQVCLAPRRLYTFDKGTGRVLAR